MVDPYRLNRLAGAGALNRDKAKFFFIAIAFVVILTAFLGAMLWGNVDQAKKEAAAKDSYRDGDPNRAIDIAANEDDEGRSIFKYKPGSPYEERELAEDRIRNRLSEFVNDGTLVDAKAEDPPEVMEFLADAVVWDTSVTKVTPLMHQRLSEARALFEPASYRGKFTSAFGKVLEIEEPRPFEGRVKSVENLYSLTFVTTEGRVYRVTSVTETDRRPGDWIQAYGVYYRNWPRGEDDPALCLMVSKKLEVAYPPITVTEIDPAWMQAVKEKQFEDANNTDEPPFWYLLNYAKHLGLDGYAQMREGEDFQIEHLGRMARALARLPDRYRFNFVSARGKVIDPYVDILHRDNPGKIDRVDTAVLLQPTGYFVRLASARPWDEYDIQLGVEYVQVEGIFYKKWKYVPNRGGSAREIPILIVTGIFPVGVEKGPLLAILPWIFGAVAIGLVALFLTMAFRDKKQVREFREKYVKGRKIDWKKTDEAATGKAEQDGKAGEEEK